MPPASLAKLTCTGARPLPGNTALKRKKQPYHTAQLGHLDLNERNKLLKQASKLRKLALERGAKRVSLGDLISEINQPTPSSPRPAESGLVTWVSLKVAKVGGVEAELNGFRLVAGDIAQIQDFDGHMRVVGLEPRRTKLARPDVANPHLEKVIVANIDVVCIVVSVVSPPLHPRLIDRYLVAIQLGGAEPLIIVNKCDLLDEAAFAKELVKVAPYAALNVPIFSCSNTTGEGLEALRETLAGKTCAFVGHSGVGKSSLANGLFPALELKTGELIRGYGRGAHTTTTSSLFDVGNGTKLIDTPGIRSFGLGKMSREELQAAFPEFAELSCKFRDCSHMHEPHCGVKSAAASNQISPERYETYRRMFEEVSGA